MRRSSGTIKITKKRESVILEAKERIPGAEPKI